MQIHDFDAQYRHDTKFVVTWRDHHGDVRSGLLLDDRFASVSITPPVYHVYVDSFTQTVPVHQILRLRSTGVTWHKGG